MIRLSRELLAETFSILRGCGASRRECVVYWLGPNGAHDQIDEAVHPRHTTVAGYEIDDGWLTQFWFDLARRQKGVRVQVHTHPRAAFHSRTDDDWALVHTPGFLSLVIPNFALGPISLDRTYLAERDATDWARVSVRSRLEVVG